MEFADIADRPTVNVLLYGPGKTGKTIGACTAPDPVLLVNADLPTASRQARLRNGERVREIKLPDFHKDNRDAVLKTMYEIGRELASPDQTLARTVVIDPVGELYRRMLEENAQRAIRPQLNSYGDVSVHIERLCRGLCSLPHINVVIVCHELAQKDEATGEMLRIPFTGTKDGSAVLGGKLISMVDIVGYCGAVEQADGDPLYMAQLAPGKGRTGGDRFACLGGLRTIDLSDWLSVIEAQEQQLQGQAQGSKNGTSQAAQSAEPASEQQEPELLEETPAAA